MSETNPFSPFSNVVEFFELLIPLEMLSGHTKTTINIGKVGKGMLYTFEMNFFCKFILVLYFVDGCSLAKNKKKTTTSYDFFVLTLLS